MLICEKSDVERSDIFFQIVSDGLLQGCLQAQKWLRRLDLDIVKECCPRKDTVEVDELEFLAFQQNG